jgi:tetratricopeptide (TPR) repeat protein
VRSSTARRRCLATRPLALAASAFLGFVASPMPAQLPPRPGAPASDVSNIPKPITDTFDRIEMRNRPNDAQPRRMSAEKDETCLLPPLTPISSPTIPVEQLQIPAEARKEYHEACEALKHRKAADAEKHLRKAAEDYPKYSAAWVTLGQVLAQQQQTDGARTACAQASIADPSYVPAYLCLADIAAREHAWHEVLKLSGRALELDSANNPLAYEYDAAANLNLHNLAAAEKSGLRAVEIDRDHREPRVHFVLAQIYEAKGDSEKEASQLREYVRYADSPDDIAVVEQVLSKLEEQTGKGGAVDYASESSSAGQLWSSAQRWAPADIDDAVPPVRTDTTCPLPRILEETSKRTQDLIENLQRFSANERIEQIDIDKNGKRRNSTAQDVNYVAQIEQTPSGYPSIEEYRSGSSGTRQPAMVDTGAAAFALIFHPSHVGNFAFRCEGWTKLRGSTAWQVHFEESADSSKAFTAIRIGGSVYLPRFKGRAWITTDNYNVVRIETDLISPVPQIGLQLEHLVIGYAPVEFQERRVRLWLPESASLYIDYHRHRYERVHTFSQFQLFSVDTADAIKEPITNKYAQLQ